MEASGLRRYEATPDKDLRDNGNLSLETGDFLYHVSLDKDMLVCSRGYDGGKEMDWYPLGSFGLPEGVTVYPVELAEIERYFPED